MRNPDVQALVYTSFTPLRHCRYLLLRISDAPAVRRWLLQPAVLGLVKGGADLGQGQEQQQEALAVAFTHAGLLAMGLQEDEQFPFPSAFREGMNEPARAQALADHAVDRWRWGDLAGGQRQEVHVLLAHFRQQPWHREDGPLSLPALQRNGFALVECVNTCPAYIEKQGDETRVYEPFGFRDGLAQPLPRSLAEVSRAQQERRQRVGREMGDDNLVADGEFVLGLPNEYGDPAYAPDDARWSARRPADARAPHFGSHGSYLAVRHIRQHVEAFRAFAEAHPAPDPDSPSLVEKMVGRRTDGRPLLTSPYQPADPDGFRFRVEDAEGFQCPLGSHVRRANPRDTLGFDVASGLANARLHRLIRRARVFAGNCQQAGAGAGAGTCAEASARERGCGQGLFFMALNADLDRQFEFVQQRWIANPRFADLADENDPLMGGHGARAFTVQGPAVGQRVTGLPAFTSLLGGGYFFLPGLAALRFLAGDEG